MVGASRNAFLQLFSTLSKVCEIPLGEPLVIPDGVGELIEKVFKILPSAEAGARSVPVSIVMNTKTGRPSDLPVGGDIIEIWIENLLDDDCLRKIASLEHGSAAIKYLLDLIRRECKASLSASEVSLWQHKVRNHRVTSWNNLIELRDTWGHHDLIQAYQKLEQAGVFKLDVIDEMSCLPRTSQTDHNPDMSQRFWVTDTCFGAILQRKQNPNAWKKALVTISAFHLNDSNLDAVRKTVQDPDWYRNGDWRNGVAHIFLLHDIHGGGDAVRWVDGVPDPNSLMEDPAWGNRKRLESQGLTLLRILETILAGSVKHSNNPEIRSLARDWGLDWQTLDAKSKAILLGAVRVLSAYLLAVQWNGTVYDMQAPTVSSWEEAPLPSGCTSDVGFILDAFKLMQKILFDKSFNGISSIESFRADIFSGSENLEGRDFFEILGRHSYADFRNHASISDFIRSARRLLSKRVVSPTAKVLDSMCRASAIGLSQTPSRDLDSSLALLGYHSSFDENSARHANALAVIIRDTFRSLGPSNKANALGMRRYLMYTAKQDGVSYQIFDSYLGLRFNLGLVAPALVRCQFASMISDEWSKIAPFYEDRVESDSVSPRDEIVHLAFQRFVAPNGNISVLAKKDATTPEALSWRQQFQLPDWSACWTIGPTASLVALGKAKIALLKRVLEVGWNDVLRNLYFEIQELLDDMTNLCLKTIVAQHDADGKPIIRADGTTLPNRYNVMEAFQSVLTPEGNVVLCPGDHTLMWSMVQTEKGLRLAIEAAKLEDRVREENGDPEILNKT